VAACHGRQTAFVTAVFEHVPRSGEVRRAALERFGDGRLDLGSAVQIWLLE
jgi:hypothetical protein